MKKEAEAVEFEVLPPRSDRDAPDLSRLIAWLLDDLIRIPGTNFRIGLDPIIGLLPGLGDSSTAVLSSVLLVHALRAGVPRIVMVRMSLNILVNTILGAVPFAGDAFSAWFKSNRRNYELLRRHSSEGRTSTRVDWAIVCLAIGGILLVAIAASVAVAFVIYKLFAALVAI